MDVSNMLLFMRIAHQSLIWEGENSWRIGSAETAWYWPWRYGDTPATWHAHDDWNGSRFLFCVARMRKPYCRRTTPCKLTDSAPIRAFGTFWFVCLWRLLLPSLWEVVERNEIL